MVSFVGCAASGNVTGGVGQLVQAASVNYLQSLGAEQVKHIADHLGSDTARAALHAIVGCAGAAAQGANCQLPTANCQLPTAVQMPWGRALRR